MKQKPQLQKEKPTSIALIPFQKAVSNKISRLLANHRSLLWQSINLIQGTIFISKAHPGQGHGIHGPCNKRGYQDQAPPQKL
jgi:hypothetical protein